MEAVDTFDTTGDAYDATQTGLPNGALLHIPTEEVVGVSTCWPLAVTVNSGNLHGVKPGANGARLLRDSKLTREDVYAAIGFAACKGYAICPWMVAAITDSYRDDEVHAAPLRPMSLFVKRADGSITEPHEVYTPDEAAQAIGEGFIEAQGVQHGDRVLLQDSNGVEREWHAGGWSNGQA